MASQKAVSEWLSTHREDLIEFLLEFANVDSPRGYEQQASRFLSDWMEAQGIPVEQQPVVDGRSNVIGTLPSETGQSGTSLLFNGHLDTAFGNDEEERWTVSESDRVYRESWRDGDFLFGDDVVNDKGPIAAFLWAALAVRESDIELDGDLHLTGVVGEIGGATVDEYQETKYLGGGIGSRRLCEAGIDADFALVAEMTDFAIGHMESGVVWLKITFTGDETYRPIVPDRDDPEPGVVPDMARAALALEEWEPKYRAETKQEYDHGINRPTLGVGAMRTGHPTRTELLPGKGALYVDVRLPPGKGPKFVLGDIERVLAQAGITDVSVEPYSFQRGYVADQSKIDPLVEQIERAHERVRGDGTPQPKAHTTSMYRDINIFNEVGVPAVTFGPARPAASAHFLSNKGFAMHVDDLLDAAKIYAQVIINTSVNDA